MKFQIKEQGSTAHIAIVVILVAALLGALGFIFWQNFVNKTSQDSSTNTSATSSNTDSSTASIDISEWGLKGTYDKDVLGTLSYSVAGNDLTFSSPKVNSDILPCTGLSSSSWGITKAQAGDKDASGVDVADSWTKRGGAYYSRVYPQAGCEDKTSQVTSIDNAYKDLFTSLTQSN